MKLAVLTTETLHHAYFLQEIAKKIEVAAVVVETRSVNPTFETAHSFETEREVFERNTCFDGYRKKISDIADTFPVENVNDPVSVSFLKELSPDIIIAFGTGVVKPNVIRIAHDRILNLHGGDPEFYRGLDTHLWAIYHNDYPALVTTLHHLNEELDDGKIILQCPITLPWGAKMHELRYYNTNACIDLTIAALSIYERVGYFLSRPQRMKGRYYSFMPACLKDICFRKFERYFGSDR